MTTQAEYNDKTNWAKQQGPLAKNWSTVHTVRK
jgi:hypothetical protein